MAQKYEQGFWQAIAERAAVGTCDQIAFYEWRAKNLMERLAHAGLGDAPLLPAFDHDQLTRVSWTRSPDRAGVGYHDNERTVGM